MQIILLYKKNDLLSVNFLYVKVFLISPCGS